MSSGALDVRIPDSVTICVTSCGRLDLLARTLDSFRRYNSGGRYLLSEDSGETAVIAAIREAHPELPLFHGAERRGLMRSIDRIYAHVETDHLFHLEDDWLFEGPVDWEGALALLGAREDIANVTVRAFDEIKPKHRLRSAPFELNGRRFAVMARDAHPEFFGWSPNPGLIRTQLWRDLSPFARLQPDQMSAEVKRRGQVQAYLLPGVARHIGAGRNAPDPTMPPRPRSKIGKAIRAIKKKLYYAGWRASPF